MHFFALESTKHTTFFWVVRCSCSIPPLSATRNTQASVVVKNAESNIVALCLKSSAHTAVFLLKEDAQVIVTGGLVPGPLSNEFQIYILLLIREYYYSY